MHTNVLTGGAGGWQQGPVPFLANERGAWQPHEPQLLLLVALLLCCFCVGTVGACSCAHTHRTCSLLPTRCWWTTRVVQRHGVCPAGTLPPSWAALTKLRTCSLFNNTLSGQLPGAWTGMASLDVLYLSVNNLTGGVANRVGDAAGTVPQVFRLCDMWRTTGPLGGRHTCGECAVAAHAAPGVVLTLSHPPAPVFILPLFPFPAFSHSSCSGHRHPPSDLEPPEHSQGPAPEPKPFERHPAALLGQSDQPQDVLPLQQYPDWAAARSLVKNGSGRTRAQHQRAKGHCATLLGQLAPGEVGGLVCQPPAERLPASCLAQQGECGPGRGRRQPLQGRGPVDCWHQHHRFLLMEWLPWFNQAIRQTLRGFNSLWQRRVTHISRGELVAAKMGGGVASAAR